jgi:hypothetical protein
MPGLYWLEVFLDEEFLTKIPIKLTRPEDSAAEEAVAKRQ